MTTPATIYYSPQPVQLVAELDAQQELRLRILGTPLSSHGDTLDIVLGEPGSVTIELVDIDDGTCQWTVTAEHGTHQWTRNGNRCSFSWTDTKGDKIKVVATARNGSNPPKIKPFFVKVEPAGSRPDP